MNPDVDREDQSMRTIKRSFAILLAVAVSAALLGGKAQAAGYPERPIELIVPWEIGRAHV